MTLFIQNNHSILFLHVPKCGGSSVDKLFKSNGYSSTLEMRGLPPQDCLTASPQHQTCEKLKSIVNMKKLEDIFIIVRNPYARIVSEFNWQFRNTEQCDKPEINEWIVESLAKSATDSSFSDNHFRTCLDFIDESLPCNIFKLEDGIEFIAEFYIRENNSISDIEIPTEKNAKSFSSPADKSELNTKAIQAINQFYKYDFKAFGYNLIDSKNTEENSLQPDELDGDNGIESKVQTILDWRERTLDNLYLKLLKELDSLFANTTQKINDIQHTEGQRELEENKVRESVNALYDKTLLKVKHCELNLNLLVSSQETTKPEKITKMLKIIDQYRSLSRQYN